MGALKAIVGALKAIVTIVKSGIKAVIPRVYANNTFSYKLYSLIDYITVGGLLKVGPL